jgi:cell division protein FtsI (penicillin-binding protein 3)
MLESGVSRTKNRGKSSATRVQGGPTRHVTAQRVQRPKTAVIRPHARERAQTQARESRPLIVLIVIVLVASGLVARLVFWQVMQHSALSRRANVEHAGVYVQPPARGLILDASGSLLATDVTQDLVYAFPKEIKDPNRTASLLAPVLSVPSTRLYDLFTGGSPSLLLASNVPKSVSNKVSDLALPGIVLGPQIKRYYPQGSVASQVLGYVDTAGKGQYGVEQYYDRYLSGQAGVRSVLRDTAGNNIQVGSNASPSHDGATLTLTIDKTVQGLVEDELNKAIKVHHADSGTIIVMDPHTGNILGMANWPSYNPNHSDTITNKDLPLLQNPAIESQYEPGSTFKIVTMAAGLNSHLITPQTSFDDTGSFVVTPDFTVHNWNMSGFGTETMTQVLQHSANVGASWVASRLGTNRFYDYIKRFRLGQPTGIDLANEASGTVPFPGDKVWTIDNLYTNSYGQGLAVTPIQMIRAVAAVANGGIMMQPQVVKSVASNGLVRQARPVPVGRVISPQTAHTLTNMLVHSAVGGEAAAALIKGYNIAAKTGTANIPAPSGGYIPGATIASIVGYAPAFHPRFVALVIIRHPRDTLYGSIAAAPVMHDLFSELFMHYNIPPIPNAVNK